MTVNSFILQFYRKACEPAPLNIPPHPSNVDAKTLASIQDEVVAASTKVSAEASKQLLKALNQVPTEFPQLDAELAKIDKALLQCQSDSLKRPACSPSMPAMVKYTKLIDREHVSTLLEQAKDDSEKLALLEVYRASDRPIDAQVVQARLSTELVGYDVLAKIDALTGQRRSLINFAEASQAAMCQQIGAQFAPHLVAEASAKQYGLS